MHLNQLFLPLLKSNVCNKKGTKLFTFGCFELIIRLHGYCCCCWVFGCFLCINWVYIYFFVSYINVLGFHHHNIL